MLKKEIAELIGCHASSMRNYINQGIMDDYPENESDIMAYVIECKKKLKEYKEYVAENQYKGRHYKEGDFSLPPIYAKYEKERDKYRYCTGSMI